MHRRPSASSARRFALLFLIFAALVLAPLSAISPEAMAGKRHKDQQHASSAKKGLVVVSRQDRPKPKGVGRSNKKSNARGVAPALAWTVTLNATSTSVQTYQNFTLTATTNQDVGPTPYYIEIYYGGTRYTACGTGTSCSATLYSSWAGARYAFQARVAYIDGSNAQAWSNVVTVSIQIPTSKRLNVPFLTQLGSAGVPGVGSNNCGPASVAMAINFFGHSITVQSAAIAIRGSNTPSNGTTDFKSAATQRLLANNHLTENQVYTYDDVRREVARSHPVIILVNNKQYRYNSPPPYESDDYRWFTTAHIVVVTGYDTSYVYVNDPLRRVTSTIPSPANYRIPISTFKSAASTTGQSTSTSWYAVSISPTS